MGITIATTRVAAQVAGGNQDITTADLGGLTPGAALFYIGQCATDGVAAADAALGMGATDGTNEWAFSARDQDNQPATVNYRRGATDECVMHILNGGGVDGEANFNAWLADGVRVTWGNAPAGAYLMPVAFFAGTDLQALAGTFAMDNAVGNTVNVVLGFDFDVLFVGCFGATFNDSAVTAYIHSQGLVVQESGAVKQFCWACRDPTGAGTSATSGQITDDYGVGQVAAAGTFTWAGEFASIANGFSCTTRIGASAADEVGYLALAFGGAVEHDGQIISTPTAAGNQSQTWPGFQPSYVHCGLTQAAAIDTGYSDGSLGSHGVSLFDENDENCVSVQIEDNVGTTNTQSLCDDTAVNLPLHTQAAGHVAAFVSFDAEGWTWNFTQTQGTAKQWWAFAAGEVLPAPGPSPEEVLGRDLMYIEQVTFREPYGLQLVGGDDERLEVFLAQKGLPSL